LPTPHGCGWRCHHRLSEASPHALDGGSTVWPHAVEAWGTKSAVSRATCHHSESESLTSGASCWVRKSSSTREITSSSCKNTHRNNKHKQELLAPYNALALTEQAEGKKLVKRRSE
jgi:hypothetical protein